MIQARTLRELRLGATPGAPGAQLLSAASGLVVVGDALYVVADDELHLGVFERHSERDGERVRLFPGELPQPHRERKAAKPDLEALVRLPPFEGHPAGALLALGSGSRPNRRVGALLRLDARGALVGEPRAIDLSACHAALERELPALNIEGAVVVGDDLVLLQRGSRTQPTNALIRLPLARVLHDIAHAHSLGDASQVSIQEVVLDDIDGVPLSFTDAAALPDGRIVFCAVAECSPDTYLDGPCAGAAIGILTRAGHLQRLDPLQPMHKVEGIHAWIDAGQLQLLLVTDADDATIPSRLLAAEIPLTAP